MRQLAGKPIVIEVKRDKEKGNSTSARLFVPAAFQMRFGARMQMGKVAAVRKGSDAAKIGVRGLLTSKDPADTISGVRIADDKGNELVLGDLPKNLLANPKRQPKPLDPVLLAFDLAEFANRHPGNKLVTLTVVRPNPQKKEGVALDPIVWDSSYDDSFETPISGLSPLSIPQLGVAYWVNSLVEGVERNSPAGNARQVIEEPPGVWTKEPNALKPGDVITHIRYWDSIPGKSGWGDWRDLRSERGNETIEDRWGYASEVIRSSGRSLVQLKVQRATKDLSDPFEIILQEDRARPLADRGLVLAADTHLVKAESMLQALEYGWQETWGFITTIYKGVQRLITGQVSTRNLEGPIGIVSRTFNLAQNDIYALILFLGILSVNLAVVNFLPIPLLDGGHMVFLVYEKIRGKPASEQVRNIANFIGIGLILALMVFAFVNDIRKTWF
jgi:regulator of sigma E protease